MLCPIENLVEKSCRKILSNPINKNKKGSNPDLFLRGLSTKASIPIVYIDDPYVWDIPLA